MTKELDKLMENIQNKELLIEPYTEDDTYWVHIKSMNTTGIEYKIQSVQDLADSVKHYLLNYCTD